MNENQQNKLNERDQNENVRLEFLAAMQVVSWELREPFKQETLESVKVKTLEDDSNENQQTFSNSNSIINKPEIDHSHVTKELTSSVNSEDVNHQYLKIVPWDSSIYFDSLSESTVTHNHNTLVDKNVLIVCRHKVDQPANSFANKQSPSHFMQDYLKTLIDFGVQNNLRLNIQLAHLAEAGLNEKNVKLGSYFNKEAIDMTLALGDETVMSLMNPSIDVSLARGRLNSLFNNSNAVVSYHPFELISNPRIKSLAFEDIHFLINALLHE